MKIFNARQMRDLDAYTIEEEKISSLELMERAARGVVDFIVRDFPDTNREVVVFAGPGNNGGDGLAVARLLCEKQFSNLKVFLFNPEQRLSADCEANARRLVIECVPTSRLCFTEVTTQFEAPKLAPDSLVIDALFGIGLNKPLTGGFAAVVKFINSSKATVLAIDMPSGLMCENNMLHAPKKSFTALQNIGSVQERTKSFSSLTMLKEVPGSNPTIIKASHTLTFQFPKLAFLLADYAYFVGKLHVLPIGLSKTKVELIETNFSLTEVQDIKTILKPRPAFAHKGTFGHALLIAGQFGMAGAAILAAKACFKCGVGKLTIHTPLLNNDILQIAVPEAILSHDTSQRQFTDALPTNGFQAMAIGPGIGTDDKTAQALINQVVSTQIPIVVDADGINILGKHPAWIRQLPQLCIFTPHPGELQRLTAYSGDSYNQLMDAMEFAKKYQFYIVLKSHFSVVCTPEGKAFFNTTGNPGMATAGAGDVLTGMILAFLAQRYTQEQSCKLAVFLHGLAGDLAAEQLGEECVTASDIIAFLPQAFKKLRL